MNFLAQDFGHVDSTTLPRIMVRAGAHIGKELVVRAFVPIVRETAGTVLKEIVKAIILRRH